MAAGVVWNPERRRLEMRDALGNILQVFMVEGSDPTGLPPNVMPFVYVPDDVKDMVRRAIAGDPGAPAQIANSVAADNVFFEHLAKNPPGTTTTPAGNTVAVAQSPEMITARTNIALTAANAADAKAKLDLREQGLRNAYAAIGKGDQFPGWAPPQRAAAPGQSAPPPAPEDYGFSQQDVVALEQDPAYVRAFTNLGGTAVAIAIMARERALDQAEAQLGERKTDLDKFNAFKKLHQDVGDLETEKGEYIQDQYRDWNRQTHKITGSGGLSAGGEHETNPTADLSGVRKYDRAIEKTRQARDEALAAYRPKEFEWEQKQRLATDKGRLQSLAPHQWNSFFPDAAERKKLQQDAYGSEYPTYATGGVYSPEEEEARRRGKNPTNYMRGGDRTPEQNAEVGRARALLALAGLPENLAGEVAQAGIDPSTGRRTTPMTSLEALGFSPEQRPDLYRTTPPAYAAGGVFAPRSRSLGGVSVPGAPPPPAPPPTVANAPAPSAAPPTVASAPPAPPPPTVAGAPPPSSGPTTVEAAQATQAAAVAAAQEAALAASNTSGVWGTGQLDEPNGPESEPPLYPGDRHSPGQTPTRQQLLRHETAQQLSAIQKSADAELRSIAQQAQSIGAQLAQGMAEIQSRQQQGREAFSQQMAALQERRTAQKAEFDVRIATAKQQTTNQLAGFAAQQTEAAGRNPFQPQFLGQTFNPNSILPPMPVRRQ